MRKLTTKDFIERSKIIHNYIYNYDKVVYVNNTTKVIIVCPIHDEFFQKASYHLSGRGCQKCSSSKGELFIWNFLKTNNIKFIEEKRFKECKNKRPLPFDFYLPEYNMCIEYDGRQF